MRTIVRTLLMSAALAVTGATVSLAPSLVLAAGPETGQIWFGTGADSLEVDDEGKLTAEGAKTRASEIDRIPGEEDWELKLHARLNSKAGEGPIYVEFYGELNGKEYQVWSHEDPDFDGSKSYTTVLTLESNVGFNKNYEYKVKIIQSTGSKDLLLASGEIKLIDTGREAPGGDEEAEKEEDGEEAEEDGEEEEEEAEEDEDEGGEGGSGEAPPPIEDTPAKKKGCTVASGGALDVGFSGLAILLLAAASRRRRRD